MKCFESIDDDYKGETNSIQIRLLIREKKRTKGIS